MKTICDSCGKEIIRKPSKIRVVNFCDKKCRHDYTHVKGDCTECGKYVERLRSSTKDAVNLFCSFDCLRRWNSKRFTGSNPDWNSVKMTPEIRLKIRESRLDTGEGKSYRKLFGKHEHRVFAEIIIGRKLLKGEVVHHIDENKRNNAPENLLVLESQKEHASLHAILNHGRK